VVVLTFNCEAIIGETLVQARKLDPTPFVVDSFSSDSTAQRAQSGACEWVQREFKNYAEQRNWAIAQLATSTEWQLHLDADEVLDDEAVDAIRAVLDADEHASHAAYMLRRVDYFMGRELRHSGVNPWHLRLFRSGQGACENRLYDQHFVSAHEAGRLAGCMHDKNSVRLTDWTARHNRWSDLEVAELLREQHAVPATGVLRGRFWGDPRERTRWLKAVYYRLPGGLRATAYFAYRYVFRLGFLDGREGLYFAFLQALWFRMLVDAKLYEARQSAQHAYRCADRPKAQP
jgi:glycosyltransferase involved in cell wall biosynthesis